MKLGVSYFGNRMPRHFIERDLPEIAAMGCTFVLHTFSEYDLQFYGGAVREITAASKDAGLEVYLDPWGVAGVFGGEAYSRFLLQHQDAWQVRKDRSRTPLACPNSPALRTFMEGWIETAAGVGPDVLFWDEPHFTQDDLGAGPGICRCAVCEGLYQERYGAVMPDTMTPDLAEFHEDSIVRFIAGLCQTAAGHGLRNALCLLPFDDGPHGLQHWEKLAALPTVDILGVTPFWRLRGHEVQGYVRQWAGKVRDLCETHHKEPQVWLQAFLIAQGREHEVHMAAEAAYEAGIRNIAAWGYRACEHMTALRPDQPEAVWEAVRDAFTGLHRHP
ncbi:MAG: hypothetical protein WD645_06685 [Dehalococcoidia bacterium]